MKSILVLPVGGSATRMQGLPKFMLPANNSETLIEQHCLGARSAGYDEIHIVTRSRYLDFVKDFVLDHSLPVSVHGLPYETSSMSETLKIASQYINHIDESLVSVGLADTTFLGESHESIYRKLLKSDADFSLALFSIREDQFGKLGQVDLSFDGAVLDMKDKTLGCQYPLIWGLAKVPGSFLAGLDISDAHIGISIERVLTTRQQVFGFKTEAEYFDCGTFGEYVRYLYRSQIS